MVFYQYTLLFLLSHSFWKLFQEGDNKVSEFEVWQGLANLYASLSYWRDAEICLQKAKALKTYSATTLHAEGEETLVTDS